MSSDALTSPLSWAARLAASPELFPLDFDPLAQTVSLVELARIDYERASFLDGRLERPVVLRPAYAELAEAARPLPVAADFIFHIGHVGSTLLSRLLGFHPRIFSLREPQALRTLAQNQTDSGADPGRLRAFMALYSRVWTPGERVLLKATSLVSEIAAPLLDLDAQARALMMTVQPATYLATILGGPNSRIELAGAAPARLSRLRRRLGEVPEPRSEGELAAMSWACEMTALAAAVATAPGRAAWLDFDRFLADPRAGLAWALSHLHGAAEPAAVERLVQSGFLSRYSKAPTYAYGPQVREEVLRAAEAEAGEEILKGLAWLDRAAAIPQVAEALALGPGSPP